MRKPLELPVSKIFNEQRVSETDLPLKLGFYNADELNSHLLHGLNTLLLEVLGLVSPILLTTSSKCFAGIIQLV